MWLGKEVHRLRQNIEVRIIYYIYIYIYIYIYMEEQGMLTAKSIRKPSKHPKSDSGELS